MVAVTIPKRPPPSSPTAPAAGARWRLLLPRSAPYVVLGAAGMHLLYRMLHFAYEHPAAAAWLGVPAADSDYCRTSATAKCGRPDLFAFQCVSTAVFWTLGPLAAASWHLTGRARRPHLVATPAARLAAGPPETEWVAALNLAYQLWDFAVSLTIPEHGTAVMLAHHATAAIVAYLILSHDLLGCHAAFFLGLSEVSSMFLVLLDVSHYFAPDRRTRLGAAVEAAAGPAFVLTFVYYRVLRWWPVTLQLARDVRHAAATAERPGRDRRPGRTRVLYLLLALSVPMGFLQLYWLTLIAQEARAALAKEDMA